MKLNKLAAAIALVAASTGANAAWNQGDTSGFLNFTGELLFVAWDTSAADSSSYYLDLGDAGDFTYPWTNPFGGPGGVLSGPANITATVGDDYADFVANSVAAGGDIRWSIVGGSNNAVAQGVFFTSSDDVMNTSINGATANNGKTSLTNTLNGTALMAGSVADNFDLSTQVVDAQTGVIGALNLGTSLDMSAAVNEDMEFWGVDGFSNKFEYGFWSFDGTNIVYNEDPTGPVVPVPAAAWLFGSALIGLAGAARRRKA